MTRPTCTPSAVFGRRPRHARAPLSTAACRTPHRRRTGILSALMLLEKHGSVDELVAPRAAYEWVLGGRHGSGGRGHGRSAWLEQHGSVTSWLRCAVTCNELAVANRYGPVTASVSGGVRACVVATLNSLRLRSSVIERLSNEDLHARISRKSQNNKRSSDFGGYGVRLR